MKEIIKTIVFLSVAAVFIYAAQHALVGGVNKVKITPEYKSNLEQRRVEYLDSNIKYIRDITTGICFAQMTSPPHGMGISAVDCNDLTNVEVFDFSSPTIE